MFSNQICNILHNILERILINILLTAYRAVLPIPENVESESEDDVAVLQSKQGLKNSNEKK